MSIGSNLAMILVIIAVFALIALLLRAYPKSNNVML